MPALPGIRREGHVAALLTGLLAGCLGIPQVSAQVVDTTLWGTSGTVSAIARSGNTLYIAGALGEVGPNTGGGVPLSANTGLPIRPFPRVTGGVVAAVADGHGGWFIGGDFTAVGGMPRSGLAHILPDGSPAAWAPSQDVSSILRLVLSGGTLYVAGNFNVCGGQRRVKLAAFDAATGDLLPWDPSPSGVVGPYTGPEVAAVLVRGDTVFVGGNFTQIGGQPRVGLAALEGRSGQALDWYPGPANDLIHALALRGNILYVGGYFTQLAGQARGRTAAVDVCTGAVLPWNPTVTGPDDPYLGPPRVWAVAIRDSTVYIGGQFLGAGGQSRTGLAAVGAVTGALTSWDPHPAHSYSYPYPYVLSLTVQGDTVYVGGNFDTIGGQDRISLAALDAATGGATAWNPRPAVDTEVIALAVSGGTVYVGGTFRTLGPWQGRSCLAALDLAPEQARFHS
ncbi:MAG TPA: PQQ-binding-like beta-propeller repeat protein [Mycobacterium sp.]|nr:PQQ-binding-like beta-propeller repeat protein [Mycobacterium sp.]